jgi:hypothetical protein
MKHRQSRKTKSEDINADLGEKEFGIADQVAGRPPAGALRFTCRMTAGAGERYLFLPTGKGELCKTSRSE